MNKDNINQIEIDEVSKKNVYYSIIESLLFISGEPLSLKNIASIINCNAVYTKHLLEELRNMYDSVSRGLTLISIGEFYQLVTKPENSDFIQKLLKTNSRQSLSQAATETLAIIAYKQPITRIAIDEIRGVKSDRAIASLVEKNLIVETGRLDVPGRPILYSTTNEFLKYFGLHDLREMPQLNEISQETKGVNNN